MSHGGQEKLTAKPQEHREAGQPPNGTFQPSLENSVFDQTQHSTGTRLSASQFEFLRERTSLDGLGRMFSQEPISYGLREVSQRTNMAAGSCPVDAGTPSEEEGSSGIVDGCHISLVTFLP